MLLKMLVGAACVVIIAAGGYYLLGEYSRPVPIEHAAIDALSCAVMVNRIESEPRGTQMMYRDAVDACVACGFLTKADLKRLDL